MAEHSSRVNKHKGHSCYLVGHWIEEQKRYKVANALKGRFEPVSVIGISPRRIQLFVMDLMNGPQRLRMQKKMGCVEPQVVAQNMCRGLK